MFRLLILLKRAMLAALSVAFLIPVGCNQFDQQGAMRGLKEGINYTQPMKWRWTTRFRVQEVVPKSRLFRARESGWDPGIPAVGQGNYEVWITKPREGEHMLNVREVRVSHPPTKIIQGKNTDATFYYYDFSPDGHLPREMHVEVSWEFITCEQYAYLPNYPTDARPEYDKSSDLYKQYTRIESPYTYNPRMAPILKSCVDEGDPRAYLEQARAAYNYVCTKFEYDERLVDLAALRGLSGMTDAYRAFENHKGISDQITNVYIAMLRQMGIPARPVLGFAHSMELKAVGSGSEEEEDRPTSTKKKKVELEPEKLARAHICAEFYLPDVGWIPVDPTWGSSSKPMLPSLSLYGSARGLSYGSYYFGHLDTFRPVTYKDVNYTLQPEPKSRGASKTEVWNMGYAERFSGVERVVYGWEGIKGVGSGSAHGWARSKDHEGYNFDIELTLLGPPSKAEIEDIRAQLAERGINFAPSGPIKLGKIPETTFGHSVIAEAIQRTTEKKKEF